MKPPTPFNSPTPMQGPPQDDGFGDFTADTDFLQKVHNPNFPHQGAGTHVPMWLTPQLAHAVLAQHGSTGHAMPHPDIKIFKHTK